jgi:hypothetical protein
MSTRSGRPRSQGRVLAPSAAPGSLPAAGTVDTRDPEPSAPAVSARADGLTVNVSIGNGDHCAQRSLSTWLTVTSSTQPRPTLGEQEQEEISDGAPLPLAKNHLPGGRASGLKRKNPDAGGALPRTHEPPRCKTISAGQRLQEHSQLKEDGFIVQNNLLYCTLCHTKVSTRASGIKQHQETRKHVQALANRAAARRDGAMRERTIEEHFRGLTPGSSCVPLDVQNLR